MDKVITIKDGADGESDGGRSSHGDHKNIAEEFGIEVVDTQDTV